MHFVDTDKNHELPKAGSGALCAVGCCVPWHECHTWTPGNFILSDILQLQNNICLKVVSLSYYLSLCKRFMMHVI
jgi:hypothetical protein